MKGQLGSELRLSHMGFLARVRTLGGWPWIVLLSWIVAARLQEPSFFRQHGIHLAHDGAMFGGTVLLLAGIVCGIPKYWSRAAELLESAALAAFVAAAVAAALLGLDLLLPGLADPGMALDAGLRLVLVGMPLVFCFGFQHRGGARWASWTMVAAQIPVLASALRLPIAELAGIAAVSLCITGLLRTAADESPRGAPMGEAAQSR